MAADLLNIPLTTLDHQSHTLADLPAKAYLIVNVASACGFTPQYKGLEALWQRYKDRGLQVLGFPCNQFGGQEPGDEAAIRQFCDLNYGVTFPMFEHVDVKGKDAHPLFVYLAEQTEAPAWNFNKYLVDGDQVRHYGSRVAPEGSELETAVTQALSGEPSKAPL